MENRQADTPLLRAMQQYVDDAVTPFNTPGHKMGKGMHRVLADRIGKEALALDLALTDELDDLHAPHSCIKEAQDLAAELYGADHSFFVVNGTTGGIYAMILAAAGPGEKIIVPRNAHRSIIGGIILSGALPIFVQPEVDHELGLAMGVTPAAVAAAIAQHPDAKAVLVINPTYYGVAADLQAIATLARQAGMLVLVDEAHGPHLKFSEQLPLQALDAGADMCAQSTHKILGAMSQCSIVHCRGARVRVPHLQSMLQLVQSTSPNYILLASLDAARMQMAVEGRQLVAQAVELAQWLREAVNQIPGLYSFGEEKLGQPGVYALDPTKVTVTVKGLGLTGSEAERILRHTYKIQVELSDIYNVLFLITLGDSRADVERLAAALRDMAERYQQDNGMSVSCAQQFAQPAPPERVLAPREALFGQTRSVPLAEAAGCVCAEIVTFYPPGIPLICPGEQITPAIIDYCRQLQAAGLHVSGPEDYTLQTIKIVV